jgi:hypothetical protein
MVDLVFVISACERRTFRILTYTSIRSNTGHNGTTIIDQDRLMVMVQGLAHEQFEHLRAMDWPVFREYVNARAYKGAEIQ